MFESRRIAVVMPAYNAEKTLEKTVNDLPPIVDDIIVVDDHSSDQTAQVARSLGLHTIRHDENKGYGGNQKTCYKTALERNADIVVMVHPDYQYSPKLVSAMAAMITSGHYDMVLASRILGNETLKGGMPIYKYFANRSLTLAQNLLMNQRISEYHTGFRAFSRELIEKLPLHQNNDDFVFDNEMIAQSLYFGFRVGEISCPTRYFAEASSINFRRSVKYGMGVLTTSMKYWMAKHNFAKPQIFTY